MDSFGKSAAPFHPLPNEAPEAFWTAMADALPLALAVWVFGGLFGVLARSAGMSLGETAAMNAVVFAGAAQFVAVNFWAAGSLALMPLAAATLAINLRYILISASLRDVLAQWSWRRRIFAVHFVTDENWALTMALPSARRRALNLLGSGLLLYVGWNVSGAAGYLLAGRLADPKLIGLDFAFAAAFLAIALGMWRGAGRDLLPWLSAAAAACLSAATLGGSWHVIVGTAAGIGAQLVQQRRRG